MELMLAFVILAAAIGLFATEKFPIDLVACMILGALLLTSLLVDPLRWFRADKWITLQDGVSGFSNPAVITVAAMFVLSRGVERTGVLRSIGRFFTRLSGHPVILMILLMATISTVSAFTNNTAAVAIFLPLTLSVAARSKVSPSKLLIPLSYASQFGGVCTLIGTSTNLLVSSISDKAGIGPFSMFEMAQLGLILTGAGMVYFLCAGRFLLPSRRGEELTEAYQLGEYLTEFRVMEKSPLIGQTILSSKFGRQHDAMVIEILRGQEKLFSPSSELMREGDLLLVRGKVQDLMDLKTSYKLAIEPEFKLRDASLETDKLALVEAVVSASSKVLGKTLEEIEFRHRYNAVALAIQRRGHTVREQLKTLRLAVGDALLLLAPRNAIAKLRAEDDFVVLEEVDEPALRRHKAPLALLIVALVVGLAALKILPIVITTLLGCIAMAVTRCLTLEEAYRAIEWRVIFLLAGTLPLGIALEKSGAAKLIAEQSVNFIGQFGPVAVLMMIYLLTAVLTEFISNNASAVLLAPMAISIAAQMGVSPKPFLMAVAFAASTAFATPVGYQTNTMVYNAGGYRFGDYLKAGIPLIGIFWMLSVYFIPVFWPF